MNQEQREGVRIVELGPLRVASVLGYGREPETLAFSKMEAWIAETGVPDTTGGERVFGFNNPSPSAGSDQYGYEVWLTVAPEVKASGEVKIKEFSGGLYAVIRCDAHDPAVDIPAAWQKLVAWVEKSAYRPARHQWLEEHIGPLGVPEGEMVLDLYMPVKK